MLTSHYYAMGPAGAPGMTIDKLLSPDPKLERDLKIAMTAARSAGLPYRMSEGNSCWNGGQPGVSDTLASALWVADMMLEFASLGCAGVNLHGGGNGFYTPIAGSLATGFVRRPEYFGMELIKHFPGATLVRTVRSTAPTTACAPTRLAMPNPHSRSSSTNPISPRAIRTTLRHAQMQWLLTGPAIDAKQDVSLTESHANVAAQRHAARSGVQRDSAWKHKGESWHEKKNWSRRRFLRDASLTGAVLAQRGSLPAFSAEIPAELDRQASTFSSSSSPRPRGPTRCR